MRTSNITHTSPDHLNQLAMQGKIKLHKIEKLDNGFYCGTWYCFETLAGERIHDYYCVSGFGLGFDAIKLTNPFTLTY